PPPLPPLSLHDALPISAPAVLVRLAVAPPHLLPQPADLVVQRVPLGDPAPGEVAGGRLAGVGDVQDVPRRDRRDRVVGVLAPVRDRKSTRLNSSHSQIS